MTKKDKISIIVIMIQVGTVLQEKREESFMKEYEVIWEIFNKCPRNQMRDVFVEELELDDPE